MGKSVNIAVEDTLSETVLRVMLLRAKGKFGVAVSYPMKRPGTEIGQSGYGYIRRELPAFNAAAAYRPFVVLVDADDRPCPPETIAKWLGDQPQHPQLIVRVAVREVEAWLLADRSGIAEFLGVAEKCIPMDPSRLKDPKRYISRLASRSRRKEIRGDLARQPGTRSKTGPYFKRALMNFAKSVWDIQVAMKNSPSLLRAMRALDKL